MNTTLLDETANQVRERLGDPHPTAAFILGSGWGPIADEFDVKRALPYAEVQGLGQAQIAGHAGRLLLGDAQGLQWLVFQGRRHWYEGRGWEPVALPVHLARRLGASALIITNAAGGIRADLAPGGLMLIEDHINAMGASPLVGPHDPFWGPRFPDQSEVYDPRLRALFAAAAEATDLPLARGVYLAVSGPAYETPAEIRAFRSWGADAVGMSSVPEAMLAHAAGMRVAGVSCITNRAAGVGRAPLSHAEVLRATAAAMPRLRQFFGRAIRALAAELRTPAS